MNIHLEIGQIYRGDAARVTVLAVNEREVTLTIPGSNWRQHVPRAYFEKWATSRLITKPAKRVKCAI